MAYTETLLWDYEIDNSGTIVYSGSITLHNAVENYDLIVVEIVSLASDLSDATWHQTMFFEVPVKAVTSSDNLNPNNFIETSYSDREHYLKIQGTTYQIVAGASNINGVLRVWGVNY